MPNTIKRPQRSIHFAGCGSWILVTCSWEDLKSRSSPHVSTVPLSDSASNNVYPLHVLLCHEGVSSRSLPPPDESFHSQVGAWPLDIWRKEASSEQLPPARQMSSVSSRIERKQYIFQPKEVSQSKMRRLGFSLQLLILFGCSYDIQRTHKILWQA